MSSQQRKDCKYFSKNKMQICPEYMKRPLESAGEFKSANAYTGLVPVKQEDRPRAPLLGACEMAIVMF